MAITKRSELEAAIAGWIDRADLTARIPEFIMLCEARLNRVLRCADMVKRKTAQTDQDFISLPTDWLEMISLEMTGAPPGWPSVRYMDPAELIEYRSVSVPYFPDRFTLTGKAVEFAPAPHAIVDFDIHYYAKVTLDTEGNAVNWLLTKAPDVYLFGSLDQASLYLKNDPRAAMWKNRFDESIAELVLTYERTNMSGSRLNRTGGMNVPLR